MLEKKDIFQVFHKRNILIFIITFIIFLSFGTDKESDFYKIHIFLLLIIIMTSIISLIKKPYIKKINLYIFILSLFWLILPLLLTGAVTSREMHIKVIILILSYTSALIILLDKILFSKERLLILFFWLNISWVNVNILIFILSLFINIDFETTFSGVFYNRNMFAMTTVILISILIFFKDEYPKATRKKLNLLILTSIFLILLSLSLKGVMGIIILFLLYSILSKKRYAKKVLLMFILVMLSGIVILTDNPVSNRIDRFTLIFTNPEELHINESAYGRLWLLNQATELIKEKAFTGVGINNSQFFLYHPFRTIEDGGGTYSHINYLEIIISGGIISFLLFYIPQFFILIKLMLIKNKNNIENYILSLLICKLSWDFAYVSYHEFISIFTTILIFNLYFRRKSFSGGVVYDNKKL